MMIRSLWTRLRTNEIAVIAVLSLAVASVLTAIDHAPAVSARVIPRASARKMLEIRRFVRRMDFEPVIRTDINTKEVTGKPVRVEFK